ncbi:hypothetical protein [uncultured Pontibacter sp.]|uniref:hypothetical protein n=1 Tax=uncultured Pontibacter sp. TaxID=453356 RepID=UPI002612E3BE|nr:hypothetical protein [uncultured Pontibacter sp.]
MRLLSIAVLLFLVSCQIEPKSKTEISELYGERSKGFVKALMTHYRNPYKEYKEQLPPPPIGSFLFTVGAINGEDTVRILLDTVSELVKLSIIANQPLDSATIASIVKGEKLLTLNAEAMGNALVIEPSSRIDSIIQKGKKFTLDSLFTERGMQKKNLERSQQRYLIDALSKWGLVVVWDDYSATYHVLEIKDIN